MYLFSGLWMGWSWTLNISQIKLIQSSLVYKRPLRTRCGLIAHSPRRLVASVSVLFLEAGKTKVPGMEKRGGEQQPQGSCEMALEPSVSGLPAKIRFHLTHWYLFYRKPQRSRERYQPLWATSYFSFSQSTGDSVTLQVADLSIWGQKSQHSPHAPPFGISSLILILGPPQRKAGLCWSELCHCLHHTHSYNGMQLTQVPQ